MLKVLSGKVVKIVDEKTVVVMTERKAMHPLYKKVIKIHKKYLADKDSSYAMSVGQDVSMIQSRPISKRKKWKVIVG